MLNYLYELLKIYVHFKIILCIAETSKFFIFSCIVFQLQFPFEHFLKKVFV